MDIAIIGMAGRFPDAKNISEFYQNLSAGLYSVKEVPEDRKMNAGFFSNKEWEKHGYLNEIEYFDYKFFNLSLNEARHMDPNQRLLMEVAYETIENAGYNIDHFNNSNTSVWVSDTPSHYNLFFDKADPTLITGNLNSMAAGRIARFFNLRGGALVVDSSCSSSLVATHYACSELATGQSDYALVCASKLNTLPAIVRNSTVEGIESPSQKICSFSSDASGTVGGEAVICILLKPLNNALRDKDIIHAVIKGSAVNQDAALSGSLTAPDSIAQSEVIKKAWSNAGIDPASITYIEAHGTGTKLGDPIEVQGLDLAFKAYTNKKSFCSLSTVKTYIGHTDSAAGIAGIVKAALSLKFKKLFPLLNFDAPSPFIDFGNSAVTPATTMQNWNLQDVPVRRAGVSSFGLSGTNCHFVMEEAPLPANGNQANNTGRAYLVTISAKDNEALLANTKAIYDHINEQQPVLEDIIYTLTTGRRHYPYRLSAIVRDNNELLSVLKAATPIKDIPAKNKKFIFIFSDEIEDAGALVNSLKEQSACFANAVDEIYSKMPGGSDSGSTRLYTFIFQYACFRMVGAADDNKILVGDGVGQIASAVFSGELSIEDALTAIGNTQPGERKNIGERCRKLISRFANEQVVFVEVGPENYISRELRALQSNNQHYDVITFQQEKDGLLLYLKELYLHQYNPDWEKCNLTGGGKRIELPAYQFNKYFCWFTEKPVIRQVAQLGGQHLANTAGDGKNKVVGYTQKAGWSETEKKIAIIWDRVLGAKNLSVDDDFFEIGGHSVNGNKVINLINKEFEVEVGFESLFELGTIKALATHVDELLVSKNTRPFYHIEPVTPADHYDVSHSQKRLWILNQIDKEGARAYNVLLNFFYDEDVNLNAFYKAVELMVARHEIFRTVFSSVNNAPVQKVLHGISLSSIIEYADLRNEKDIQAKCSALLDKEVVLDFDLTTGPLFRIKLLHTGNKKFLIVFHIHHIIFDGASQEIFLKELFSYYQELDKGLQPVIKPFRVHYKDYAAWQLSVLQGEEGKVMQQFWLDMYEDVPPLLDLSTSYKRPAVKTYNGNSIGFQIDSQMVAGLVKLGNEKEATIFASVLSALYILLYKYTGQQDIVIGTPVTGRQHADLEDQIGYYVNTLALRLKLQSGTTIGELINNVKSMVLKALTYQSYPFDKLVDELSLKRDAARHPLFDVMMVYNHNMESAKSGVHESHPVKKLDEFNYSRISHTIFDLTFKFFEYDENLFLNIEYNTDLFAESRIRQIGTHYLNILSAFLKNTNVVIDELKYQEEREVARLINQFNPPVVSLKEVTPVSLFEEQVVNTPNNIAVVFDEKELRYAALNEKSNQLGRWLRKHHNIQRGDRVGIIADRSEWMIIGIMGILKSGAGYVPIEPGYPDERKAYMLKDAAVKCVLTDGLVTLETIDAPVVLYKDRWDEISQEDSSNIILSATPKDLAYVIYTSGSSGQPKGCMVENSNLANLFVNGKNYFDFTDKDIWLLYHSFCFDFSVWEIFGALLTGGTLVIPDKKMVRDIKALYELIYLKKITVLNQTPNVFYNFIEESVSNFSNRLNHLRYVIFGGDKLNFKQLKEWVKYYSLNEVKLVNMYGITETTIHSSYYEISDDDIWSNNNASIVGAALPGINIYILDKAGNPLPIGVTGELCVGGYCVCRGYINQPEVTAEKFLTDPFATIAGARLYRSGDLARWGDDGRIEYIGRNDFQVKIRGYRIELGEIENALLRYKGVQAAAVVLQGNSPHTYLTAYYKSDVVVIESDLAGFLKRIVPDYMVPAFFIRLQELPLTVNGKLNRAQLPDPISLGLGQSNTYVAPRNDVERDLVKAWEKILGRKGIGIKDDFFDLGGDSIKAIMLSGQLSKQGVIISSHEIYKNSTIELLSAIVATTQNSKAPNFDIVTGEIGLTPIQHAFFESGRKNRHHFNHSVLLYSKERYDSNGLLQVATKLQEHHDALRMRYLPKGQEVYQVNDGLEYPVEVSEYDLRHVTDSYSQMNHLAGNIQASMSLNRGPMMRLALFKMNDADRLLIVIHHLVIDGVSWRILFGDFGSLYEQYRIGAPLALPSKTTSFKLWSDHLYTYANSAAFLKEKDYWKNIANTEKYQIAKGSSNTQYEIRNSATVSFSLNESETQTLLTEVHRYLNVEINDILIGALAISISNTFGHKQVMLALEGHGREDIIPGIDISRTIGWFTSIYPVLISCNNKDDVANLLREVKQTLKKIPNKGIGYGILKYLTSANNKEDISCTLQPEISFNYLGQFDADLSNASLQTDAGPSGPDTSLESCRDFLIDVVCVVSGHQLMVDITYDRLIIEEGTMAGLKKCYTDVLKNIIALPVNQQANLPAEQYDLVPDALIGALTEGGYTFENYNGRADILEKIWKEIFGKPAIDRDDNFFVMSGRSTYPTLLAFEVYKKMNFPIRLCDCFNLPTIHELAAHNYDIQNTEAATVIRLQPFKPDNLPLFFVPTAAGLPSENFALSQLLKSSFNCFSFLFTELSKDEPLFSTYEEMVDRYAGDICLNTGHADVVVVIGYSWSVSVAFELTKKLESLGKTVKLVLVDMAVDGKLYQHSETWSMEEYNRMIEIGHEDLPELYAGIFKRLAFNNRRLFDGYKTTGIVNADILAIEGLGNARKVDMTVWREYTKGWFSQLFVEGDHWSVFDDRNLQSIAEQVTSFVNTPVPQIGVNS